MSKAYEFLSECKIFFVATINGNFPAVRPFGAIMEFNNVLYFSTGTNKNVYKQLLSDNHIQIVALKHGTRDWIRISGNAIEVCDLALKQEMLNACPALGKRFSSKADPLFALFKVDNMIAYLNTDTAVIQL